MRGWHASNSIPAGKKMKERENGGTGEPVNLERSFRKKKKKKKEIAVLALAESRLDAL